MLSAVCACCCGAQGPQPKIGELVAIRFKGSFNNFVFDDLYNTKEPYYFRVGGGNLLAVRGAARRSIHG